LCGGSIFFFSAGSNEINKKLIFIIFFICSEIKKFGKKKIEFDREDDIDSKRFLRNSFSKILKFYSKKSFEKEKSTNFKETKAFFKKKILLFRD